MEKIVAFEKIVEQQTEPSQGPVGTAAIRDAWTLSRAQKEPQGLRQTEPVAAPEGRGTGGLVLPTVSGKTRCTG